MLRFHRRSLLAGCLALTFGPWAQGQTPRPQAAKVDGLITQLGSRKFKEREKASAALDAIGELALDALRKAAKSHKDAEVRRRAEGLVQGIEERPWATGLAAKMRGTWSCGPYHMEWGRVKQEMTFGNHGTFEWALIPVNESGEESPALGEGFRVTDVYRIQGNHVVFHGDMAGKGDSVYRARVEGSVLFWTVKSEKAGGVEKYRFRRK